MDEIQAIHDNCINGNLRDMVAQIDEYGHYDFWSDYKDFLAYMTQEDQRYYFPKVCIAYNKIKHR